MTKLKQNTSLLIGLVVLLFNISSANATDNSCTVYEGRNQTGKSKTIFPGEKINLNSHELKDKVSSIRFNGDLLEGEVVFLRYWTWNDNNGKGDRGIIYKNKDGLHSTYRASPDINWLQDDRIGGSHNTNDNFDYVQCGYLDRTAVILYKDRDKSGGRVFFGPNMTMNLRHVEMENRISSLQITPGYELNWSENNNNNYENKISRDVAGLYQGAGDSDPESWLSDNGLHRNDNFDRVSVVDHNIAYNRPTTQSSTSWGGLSPRAVDGNTSGVWGHSSTTHTTTEDNSWWEVNLEKTRDIGKVMIWNRTDCCGERLSDYDIEILDEDKTVVTYIHVTSTEKSTTEDFDGVEGQYVRIKLRGEGLLSLAEVQVYEHKAPVFNENAAHDKPTTQSSTGFGGDSSRAVDGDTNGNYGAFSVSHTLLEYQPWWKVDLMGSYYVTEVTLFNRADSFTERLSDFHVDFLDHQNNIVATKNYSGTVKGQLTLKFPRTRADFVRVQLNGQDYLSLAEVVVRDNVALGRPTQQSSTSWGGLSPRAVDGNTDGHWSSGSVTHTASQTNAWWKVDLEQARHIGEVVLWNRTDCCGERLSNYVVEVLNGNNNVISSIPVSSSATKTIVDFGGIEGQFVRVKLNGTNFLSLAEVEVFEHYSSYSPIAWLEDTNAVIDDHAYFSNQLLGNSEQIKIEGSDGEFLSCAAGEPILANSTLSKACNFLIEKDATYFKLKTIHGYVAVNGNGTFDSNGAFANAEIFTTRTNNHGLMSFEMFDRGLLALSGKNLVASVSGGNTV